MTYTVQLIETAKLVPYELNAKKHPEDQIEKLAKAIKQFGWTQPIVVWKDYSIIAGHGRRLAALKLGFNKVPVIIRDDLTKAEADALRLSDNRVSSTEYDQEMIAVELQRLFEEVGPDSDIIGSMGFDEKELQFTFSDLGEMDDGFMTDDINEAVSEQARSNQDSIAKTDETAAPVADALGFKRVTVAQSRRLRELMSEVEAMTRKSGPEALIAALTELIEG